MRRVVVKFAVIVVAASLAACAPKQPTPVQSWFDGDRGDAVERQKLVVEEAEPTERTLEEVRLASMALAEGDRATAESALRSAVARMTTFQADGEWASVIGAEDNKEWKGEPYEKLAAFTTLGVLLHAKGDHGNAMAMYKSAILADTGTAEERFRSDFVPAWTMQALAYQAEGEAANAEQYMGKAIDSLYSRFTIDLLTSSLEEVSVIGDARGVIAAKAVLVSAMSGGVAAFPRDPQEAVRATVSQASTLLLQQQEKSKKERMPALQSFSGRDFKAAGESMPAVADAWREAAKDFPAEATASAEQLQSRLEELLANEPNVILLVERGQGPVKVTEGEYGQILKIVPSRNPGGPPRVMVDGQTFQPIKLDSLTYQATTRGGRQVDGFLKGKAVYKDASMITGYVMMEVADIAQATDNDELAAALAIIGCCLYVSGAVTNPAADVRQWEMLPNSYWLVAGTWEPGARTLLLDEREITMNVPGHGQLVALIPALPPGGQGVLGGE